MCVAIIFCAEAEHKCGQHENDNPFFPRCENESLPGPIEFETPLRFQF